MTDGLIPLTSATTPFQHEENKQGTRPVEREEPRQRPIVIRTLGDLGERNELYAYCDSCRHSSRLDLAELRERHGPDLSLNALRSRLRCSRCGARSAETTHVWDAGPHVRS
jgi:hypothetical protein